jgi:hypothetical protein
MNLNDLLLEAEPFQPKCRVMKDTASLNSCYAVFDGKLLRGHDHVKLGWVASAKLLVMTPCEKGDLGAKKAAYSPTGSGTINIAGLRSRVPALPTGRFPITVHGNVIVIGVLPDNLDREPAVPLRGSTAAEMIEHLYDDGVAVSEAVARAVAAQTGLSVVAVRHLADKHAARMRQGTSEIQKLKNQGRTPEQIARAGRRAAGEDAEE